MAKKMLIDATHAEETRVVVADGTRLEEFDFESITKKQIAGNIYLAKVMRVEPSLQAAFVDYGGNRHGFLAFSEIHPDYYQIPKAERDALVAAMARDSDNDNDDDTADEKPRAKRGRSRDQKSDSKDDNERSNRRGSRRGGRHKRSGSSRGNSVKRARDGSIIEREFRISGGMKVRLLRADDGTGIEQEFKLEDGTRVRLSKGLAAGAAPAEAPKTMAMATDLDDKVSADADDVAEMPDEVGRRHPRGNRTPCPQAPHPRLQDPRRHQKEANSSDSSG